MITDEKKHIFLVDDNLKLCEAIKEAFEQLNLKVSYYTNAKKCIKKLDSHQCDLLITDLKMSGINGIELLNRVKRLRPSLPIVIITGNGDIPIAVKAIKEGASDFIEKPLDIKAFSKKIHLFISDIKHSPPIYKTLTKSEHEVLKLVFEGKSSSEIGFLTHRSARTIEFHRTNIMKKLGVTNVVDMIVRALYLKLLEIPENKYQSELDGKTSLK